MFKIISKIFFAVAFVRVIAAMNRFDGPFKYIAIIAFLILGIRMVFSQEREN